MVAVDPWQQWADPQRSATEFHQSAADPWLTTALEGASPCEPEWLESWRTREEKAQAAIASVLGTDLSEPQVARAVHRFAAANRSTIVVSASMPIRDLEWFAATERVPPRVLAKSRRQRDRRCRVDGVGGRDIGVGSAPGQGEAHTIALLGDLAFLHDVSGLVNLPDVPCTFVVVDNGGGGIFSFLPQAASLEEATFERLFGTPPNSDIGAVARGFGLPVHEVTSLSQLEPRSGRAGARARTGQSARGGHRTSLCTRDQ